MDNLPDLKEIQMVFGQRLKSCLESRGISQSEFARQMLSNRSDISRYCTGKHLPQIEDLYKMSELLNVSIDYLLGKTEIESPNMEIRTICEHTGLPEEAIIHFGVYKDTEYCKQIYPKVFDSSFFTLIFKLGVLSEDSNFLNELADTFPINAEILKKDPKVSYIPPHDYEETEHSLNNFYNKEIFDIDNWQLYAADIIQRIELQEYKIKKEITAWIEEICHSTEVLKKSQRFFDDLTEKRIEIKKQKKQNITKE